LVPSALRIGSQPASVQSEATPLAESATGAFSGSKVAGRVGRACCATYCRRTGAVPLDLLHPINRSPAFPPTKVEGHRPGHLPRLGREDLTRPPTVPSGASS